MVDGQMRGSGKILVVEDDKFTGRMMELQFRKHGYEVRVAADAEEALGLLSKESFDLVLSDVMMPNISGLELLRQIRERLNKETLPVVLVTAREDLPNMAEAVRLGVNDFFAKPKEFGVTLSRVSLHVELKKMREALLEKGASSDVALRASGDGLWNWHIAKGAVHFSARWKAILGFGPQELGKNVSDWLDRIHPDDQSRFSAAVEEHQQRKRACVDIDYRIQHKNGEYLWVHSFGFALFGKDGEPLRMVGSMCKLSGLKEIERGCARLQRDLTAYQRKLSAFGESAGLDDAARSRFDSLLSDLDELREEAGRIF